MDKYTELDAAQRLVKTMQEAKARSDSYYSDPDPARRAQNQGAADQVLLSNHLAMTLGSVKGARVGEEQIRAHLAARSLPERLATIASKVISGGTLSEEQRTEFLHLGQERLKELQQAYDQAREVWNYTPPGQRPGGADKPFPSDISPDGKVTPKSNPELFEKVEIKDKFGRSTGKFGYKRKGGK